MINFRRPKIQIVWWFALAACTVGYFALKCAPQLLAQVETQVETVVPAFESQGKASMATIVFRAASFSSSQWSQAEPETLKARIVDFNATSIIYKLSTDSSIENRPSNTIDSIVFSWGANEAAEADRSFASGHYTEVIRLGKTVVSGGKLPSWQQRLLVAKMVDAFWMQNQRVIAGKLFLSLLKDSAPEIVYEFAPLVWQTTKIDSAMAEVAEAWLKETESRDAQLLGASWLLGTPRLDPAKVILEKLSLDSDSPVSQLATAQLWRLATPKEVINKYEDWKMSRDRLPVFLQMRPSVAIAEKLERSSLKTQALQEYLRVVGLASMHTSVDRQARARAADILRSLNRADEANLISKFP